MERDENPTSGTTKPIQTAMMQRQRTFFAQTGIGLLILALLLWQIDLKELLYLFKTASVGLILSAYALFLPSLLFRSWRWRCVLKEQNIQLTYAASLHVYAYSIFVGSVTPGRLGELIKAVYLQQQGHAFGVALYGTFLDRLFDVLFLLLVGEIVLVNSIFPFKNPILTFFLILILTGMGIASLLFFTRGVGKQLMLKLLESYSPKKQKETLIQLYRDFANSFCHLKMKTVLGSFCLTALAWGASYTSVYFLGKALGFGVPYVIMMGIAAVCALVALVPVTFLGVGTRDLALMQMLAPFGITEAGAIALSTLILSMLFSNALICAFFLCSPVGQLVWKKTVVYLKSADNSDRSKAG
jgi:uncharacterized protein (TIRG00374 family)